MKLNDVILSWDTLVALALTLITAIVLPSNLSMTFCLSFYNIGITVLSIIFSIFFAALAIVMASSDNDFIEFLEENNDFTALLNSFKITLIMLFVSLLFSIILTVWTNYSLTCEPSEKLQNKTYFLIFEFLFSYSLFATGLSVKDTITFSYFRAKFLSRKNK
jgi:hypothetical protein